MMMFVSSNKGKPAALCNITSLDLGGEILRLTGSEGREWMTYSSATCVVMRHYPQTLTDSRVQKPNITKSQRFEAVVFRS
jgi:hypothetical protein